MNADKTLNEIGTYLAYITVTMLLIFYVLGMNPSRADTPKVPIAISQMLVGSCAEITETQKKGNVYRVGCISHTGSRMVFVFRVDSAGGLYIDLSQAR